MDHDAILSRLCGLGAPSGFEGPASRAAAELLRPLADEVTVDRMGSVHFFMGLKLKAGLAELDTGKAVTGAIDVARLSSLDRDLLKDTLGVVKRFKVLLRHRFHLDAVR